MLAPDIKLQGILIYIFGILLTAEDRNMNLKPSEQCIYAENGENLNDILYASFELFARLAAEKRGGMCDE